ncbi:MAG: FixH family protein, partial [Porticoccus sp.]|nr:FixH family protein [Porticoccus sp.]
GMDTKPWYRQFWPWFLMALPGSVVIAGLTTVYIAFNGADTLVNDNYYRDGLAINQSLEQDRLAIAMGLSAELRLDSDSGELFVTLIGAEVGTPKLLLQLLHPTDETRDRDLSMSLMSPNHYRVDLERNLRHRYYLRLLPAPEHEWRLSGEINFSNSSQVTLLAQ